MQHIDVRSRAEIGEAAAGMRYLDFLGGSLELRCFAVPHDMPRAQFMAEHRDLLDPCLLPIYEHDGICVRQDASYAVPGFYIVSFAAQYRSIDEIPAQQHLRSMFIVREVRRSMRDALGIHVVHHYCEEKPDPSCNVHHWILPIRLSDGSTVPIMRLDLRAYLAGFTYREQRPTILICNEAMRASFAASDLHQRDNDLMRALNRITPEG